MGMAPSLLTCMEKKKNSSFNATELPKGNGGIGTWRNPTLLSTLPLLFCGYSYLKIIMPSKMSFLS